MSCPSEPIPQGWKVWRGAVPTELTQIAMDVRDHVNKYQRGTIVQTVDYGNETVGVFVSTHTWTYRRQPDGTMKLVTGICIPGVSLLTRPQGVTVSFGPPDSLDNPDPTAAVYGVDESPPEKTNWGLVALTAAALAALGTGFVLAVHHAGRAGLLPR